MADLISADMFDRLPERYQRRAREISARVAELRVLLARCDAEAIADAAGRLQGQLRWQPETDHEAFGREFRPACADLLEWAVSEATNDFLSGRIENHTGQFMPSCAEFARHARAIIAPFIGEMNGLRNEAERLFERAEDEARRAALAVERADPAVRTRVRVLLTAAKAGAPLPVTGRAHIGTSPETQAEMDKLRIRRPQVSK
ncbi:MAG: hypothetical protein ACT6U0_27120, partial [Shinella sp.]